MKTGSPGHSRCAAPSDRRGGGVARTTPNGPATPGIGAAKGPWRCAAWPQTTHRCASCVLLCTTRESARLSQETGLFNLRLSSDAPNLQVENEETIEALSARTEALLEGIQQRFSFVRSIRTRSCRSRRLARLDDRPLFRSCSFRWRPGPHSHSHLHCGTYERYGDSYGAHAWRVVSGRALVVVMRGTPDRSSSFLAFRCISFSLFSRARTSPCAGMHSLVFNRSMRICERDSSVFENNRFSRFSRPKAPAMTTRFLA